MYQVFSVINYPGKNGIDITFEKTLIENKENVMKVIYMKILNDIFLNDKLCTKEEYENEEEFNEVKSLEEFHNITENKYLEIIKNISNVIDKDILNKYKIESNIQDEKDMYKITLYSDFDLIYEYGYNKIIF